MGKEVGLNLDRGSLNFVTFRGTRGELSGGNREKVFRSKSSQIYKGRTGRTKQSLVQDSNVKKPN